VRLEDDLGEVQLQLGQTMRIFGYLQAADPVGSMSKVPGFGHTQVHSSLLLVVIVHVTLRPYGTFLPICPCPLAFIAKLGVWWHLKTTLSHVV